MFGKHCHQVKRQYQLCECQYTFSSVGLYSLCYSIYKYIVFLFFVFFDAETFANLLLLYLKYGVSESFHGMMNMLIFYSTTV